MKTLLRKGSAWWHSEQVRRLLTLTVVAASIAVYAVIFYFGHRPAPPPAPDVPFFLRLHPERLLACGATLLGMLTAVRRFHANEPVLEPLSWIFFASIVHLASLAVQFHWI